MFFTNGEIKFQYEDKLGMVSYTNALPCNVKNASGDKRAMAQDGTFPKLSVSVIADSLGGAEISKIVGATITDNCGQTRDFILNWAEKNTVFDSYKFIFSLL